MVMIKLGFLAIYLVYKKGEIHIWTFVFCFSRKTNVVCILGKKFSCKKKLVVEFTTFLQWPLFVFILPFCFNQMGLSWGDNINILHRDFTNVPYKKTRCGKWGDKNIISSLLWTPAQGIITHCSLCSKRIRFGL